MDRVGDECTCGPQVAIHVNHVWLMRSLQVCFELLYRLHTCDPHHSVLLATWKDTMRSADMIQLFGCITVHFMPAPLARVAWGLSHEHQVTHLINLLDCHLFRLSRFDRAILDAAACQMTVPTY